MRYTRIWLSLMMCAAVAAPAAALAFDPQAIVGSWQGTWDTGQATGAYYITIKKVVGDKAEGTLYIDGPARYHRRDIQFTGTLDGASLSLKDVPTLSGSPVLNQVFTISDDGTRMEGEGLGTVRAAFSLKKK